MAQSEKPSESDLMKELQGTYKEFVAQQKELNAIGPFPKGLDNERRKIALEKNQLKLKSAFERKERELKEYLQDQKNKIAPRFRIMPLSEKEKEKIASIEARLQGLQELSLKLLRSTFREHKVHLRSEKVELGTSRNERPLSPSGQKMLTDIEELRARRAALERSDSDDLDKAVKKPQPIQKSNSQELKSPREQQEVIEGRRAEVATAGGNLIPSEGSPKAPIPEPLIPKPPKSLPFLDAIKIGAKLKPAIIESELPEPPRTAPSAEKAVIPPKPPSLLEQIQQGGNLRKPKVVEVTEKTSLFGEMAEQRRKLKVVPEEEKKDKSAPIIEGPSSPHGPFQGSTINNMLAQRERQQPQQLTKQSSGVDDSEWGDELEQSANNLRKSGMAVTGAGSISSPPTTPKSPQRGGGKGRF